MTMKIKNEFYWLLFSYFPDERFYSIRLRVQLRISPFPTPVEVIAYKVTTVISYGNSINVDHRNDVEVVPPDEEISLSGVS